MIRKNINGFSLHWTKSSCLSKTPRNGWSWGWTNFRSGSKSWTISRGASYQ